MQELLICASGCTQKPGDVQVLLSKFQKSAVVLAMVCAKPRANSIKNAPSFAQFMVIASDDMWCVPHRIQLDKAKIMDLLLLCFQHEKTETVQKLWVL